MLKIFRKNQFLRSLLLLPLALILNVNMLIVEVDVPAYNNLLDQKLFEFRQNWPLLHWFLFGSLLFSGAVLINRIIIINRLSNHITLFPGLFFLFLISAFPVFSGITSISLTLILFILFMSNLMYINTRGGAASKVFNAGIYFGLMCLLCLTNLVFAVLAIITMNALISIGQKSILNFINGGLLPVFIALVILLLTGQTSSTLAVAYENHFGLININLPDQMSDWITLVVLFLFSVFVLVSQGNVISKKSIQGIRKINVLTWTILFAIVIHLFSGQRSLHNLMLLIPALGFYISEGVLRFKKESNAELILILLFILCVIMPFV